MHDDPPPAPVFVQPAPDPALAVLTQQTQNQGIQAQQAQSTLDTAHLMQRYGIMAALGVGTPAAGPAPAAAPVAAAPANPLAGVGAAIMGAIR